MKQQNKQQNADAKVKIIPLGGLEQIGMNITAIECNDSIIVVDCGLAFPSDDMLGIDLCIPDVTYLKQNIDKVKGFVSPMAMRTISAPFRISFSRSMFRFMEPS